MTFGFGASNPIERAIRDNDVEQLRTLLNSTGDDINKIVII